MSEPERGAVGQTLEDGAQSDEAGADAAESGELALGSTAAQVSDATSARQVITTGDVLATASDPRAAADAIVAIVEREGGRVDSRVEHAGTGDQDAHASLTVRIPSDDMTTTLAAIEDIGDVLQVNLTAEDVTGDVQDLEARIRAMQLSVARMEDLLARATTNADVISAESALAERQAELESMQTRRSRIAEQVSLSTLRVEISTPSEAPPVAASTGPRGFLDGLAAGWTALVSMLGGLMVAVGAVLPWAVFAGLVTAAVLAVLRAVRKRRSPIEASSPSSP